LEQDAQPSLAGAEIIRSGRPDLNEEALRLVRSWLYQPANCNGKPIAAPIDVTVHFQRR
jgi:TonB family protein